MILKNVLKKAFFVVFIFTAASGIFFLWQKENKTEIQNPPEIIIKELIPKTLSWQEATSSANWKLRDSYAALVFKNKMWLMGGLNGSGTVSSPNNVAYGNAEYFSDVWSSENGIDWQLLTDTAPWGKRRSIQVAEFKGKLWLMGGWGPFVGLKNDIWTSEDGINWEEATDTANWPAREGHQLAVFKDKLWLMGGVVYDQRKTKNDVWYSEDGINWQEATSSPNWTPRWDHGVVVFDGKMWLMGGMDLNDRIYQDLWYSDDGINWILATDSPPWEARQGNGFMTFRNNLWIIGRFNDILNEGPNDVWYSENGINWQKTDEDPGWPGKEDITALEYKDKIWIFGGMNSNWEWTNDVWFSVFSEE